MASSFFTAFIFIIINVINIILLKKQIHKNEKSLAHYEAIADMHMKKLYNPFIPLINNILYLIIASFFLSDKELIIIYIFWCVLQNISAKLIILLSSLDILSLKNGLITMFLTNNNAFTKCWDGEIIIENCLGFEGKIKENEKYFLYKYRDNIIYRRTIDITNLSDNQIKELKLYHKQLLNDYLRYIPQYILRGNDYKELSDWFVYLDDVRENF